MPVLPLALALLLSGQIDPNAPTLGVTVATLSDAEGKAALDGRKPPAQGVVVVAVEPYGPAGKGGLKIGNVIRKLDETPVETPADLDRAVRSVGSGTICILEGYTPSGGNGWKVGKMKIRVMSLRDLIQATVIIKEDKVRGLRFHEHRHADRLTEYPPPRPRGQIALLISEKPGEPPILFWRFRHREETPLHLRSLTIRADDHTYEITLRGEVQRESLGGSRIETYQHPIHVTELPMIREIVSARHIIVRFNGVGDLADDVTIPGLMRDQLRTMLACYEILISQTR